MTAPLKPTRFCLNSTGPGLSSFIASATSVMIGAKNTSNALATTRSCARFAHQRPGVEGPLQRLQRHASIKHLHAQEMVVQAQLVDDDIDLDGEPAKNGQFGQNARRFRPFDRDVDDIDLVARDRVGEHPDSLMPLRGIVATTLASSRDCALIWPTDSGSQDSEAETALNT